MKGKEAARLLNLIANILEFKGENPFKIRAYRKAAHYVEGVDDLEELVRSGKLKDVKGIGSAIESKLKEFVETGDISHARELLKDIPETLIELFDVPGLGPKKIRTLYEKLGIKSLSELEYACSENRLIALPGFGGKSQEKILKGIDMLKRKKENFLLPTALEAWKEVQKKLEDVGIKPILTGKLRRKDEVFSSFEFIILEDEKERLRKALDISEENVEDERITGRTSEGIPFACIPTKEALVPQTLLITTGSKAHLDELRPLAGKRGFGLDTWEGVASFESEDEIYEALGLSPIPPELREGLGEISASMEGRLPNLVTLKDLRGIIHIHTAYSDGRNTIEEIAAKAMEMGFGYIGISDHSKSAYYAGGLKEDDIKRQHEEIDRLNERFKERGFRIFKGIESDILPDGSLDYPERVLEAFDFVIASIHSRFNMEKEEMTKRIIRALENPYTTILGHPTGRLILGREPYKVDVEEIIQCAKENGKALELNCHPMRLDLSWRWLKKAKDAGVKISIGPDAHNLSGLNDVIYGIMIARKGWIEKKDLFQLE